MLHEESIERPYHIEPLAEGVRFVLPRRPGGQSGGLCLILFGMIFSGFAIVWMLGASGLLDPIIDSAFESFILPADHMAPPAPGTTDDDGPESTTPGPETPGPESVPGTEKPPAPVTLPSIPTTSSPPASSGFDFTRLLFALFGVPFFLAGLMPMLMGVLTLVGHSEIELSAEAIRFINRAGFLRRTQVRIASELTRVEIGRGPLKRKEAEEQIANGRPLPQFTINAIHAEFVSETPLTIAIGYPMTTLRSLAKEMTAEIARLTGKDRVEVEEPHDQFTGEQMQQPYVPEDLPPQPANSKVIIEHMGSGITLRVPPAGFTKAAMVPFLFGVFWCGFVALFTVIMFAMGVPWPMYLFISFFWVVGIAVLLLGVSIMRMQAVIDVVHDTLLVTQQGLFGRKQSEWLAQDLLDIRVDHSGSSVNDVPINNLQFIPRQGRALGLFTSRDDEELHWMAAELRVALHLPKKQ